MLWTQKSLSNRTIVRKSMDDHNQRQNVLQSSKRNFKLTFSSHDLNILIVSPTVIQLIYDLTFTEHEAKCFMHIVLLAMAR